MTDRKYIVGFVSFTFKPLPNWASYGPGLYTYVNPAQAHQTMKSSTIRQEPRNALIQCRVVTRPNSAERGNSYSVSAPRLPEEELK